MAKISNITLKNTRDLGGIRTKDNKVIKPKRIIRSGRLFEATSNDIDVLKNDYNLRTVVDFRTHDEYTQHPDVKIDNVKYYWVPIIHSFQVGITQEERKEKKMSELDFLIDLIEKSDFDVVKENTKFYPSLVLDDYSKDHYKEFLNLVEKQDEGSLLYHCSAGKDRVGVGTALLLSALNVDRETILDDYESTNKYIVDDLENLRRQAENENLSEDIVEQVVLCNSVHRLWLESVFNAIDSKYGSIENYLQDEMDLNANDIAILKDKYLE